MSLVKSGCRALLCGVLSAAAAAEGLPRPPESGSKTFPGWQALSVTGAVSRMVKPMSGAPRPEWQTDGCLRLPFNFASVPNDRIYWDVALRLDLRQAKGVAFDFFCRDPECFTGGSLYFRSGDGWYTASFPIRRQDGWQRVAVAKADTRIEGRVAGWGAIDTVRIAGWRCRDMDTECAIANFRPHDIRPKIIVLRAESHVLKKGDAGPITKFAANVCGSLDDIGLESVLQSDIDLTPAHLAGVPLVALPYNPEVPAESLKILAAFVAGGGKLLAFYSVPEGVRNLLGIGKVKWVSDSDSMFSGFSKTGNGLAAQPEFVPEASGHAVLADVAEKPELRIAAVWRDRHGKDTDHAALTLTPSGAFFGRLWDHGDSIGHAAL
ncbi:MAG: hypothetical protein PHE10_02540, partial [Kiritimatiellae bacterium]|nr:hypothetical protein [Kiritimatiellia bacterium]